MLALWERSLAIRSKKKFLFRIKVLFNSKPFLELAQLHEFLLKNLYSIAMLNFS